MTKRAWSSDFIVNRIIFTVLRGKTKLNYSTLKIMFLALHAKFFLLMHAANKIIWIQHSRCQQNMSVKGFMIPQTLIPNFSAGMSKRVRVFVYVSTKSFRLETK